MKALTFTGIQSITYEDIPDPIIEDQMDVIVKTSYCAICGSDLHIYHGRERGIDSHTAMGHEFTGEVVEAGSAVTSLKLGDQVVSAFTTIRSMVGEKTAKGSRVLRPNMLEYLWPIIP